MDEDAAPPNQPFPHADVVESRHRFPQILFRGERWDLSHLDPFALVIDPGLGFPIDLVILFSDHCFTQSPKWDLRNVEDIPAAEFYQRGKKPRVLSEDRYRLSRKHLRELMNSFITRSIRVFGAGDRQNFVTFEGLSPDGQADTYVVFFEVTKDRKRERRLLLHVQSAYRLPQLEKRLVNAQKVKATTLLRKAYAGTRVKNPKA